MLRVWDCNSVLHSIDLCCVCCNAESYAPSPNNGTETMTPWKRVSSAKQTNPNLALYSIVCCTAPPQCTGQARLSLSPASQPADVTSNHPHHRHSSLQLHCHSLLHPHHTRACGWCPRHCH